MEVGTEVEISTEVDVELEVEVKVVRIRGRRGGRNRRGDIDWRSK